MVDIPIYERDESLDYLSILRSLNEIPFPVGKNLLIDFLKGDMENKSVLKNNLYDLYNFESLNHLTKEKISSLIESLIINKMIDLSPSVFNKFIKVLSINNQGKAELINPTLNSKKVSEKYEEVKTIISDREIEAFKELEEFLKGYNLEQKKAIISKKEKILCIAGAGSGKTTVLTKRIKFLNKYQKIKGEKILAITFTRKARQEMQKRLNELGINAIVETFNSFSEKILLKHGGKIYGKKVRITSFQEKMGAIIRALDSINLTFPEAIEKYFSPQQKRNKSGYQLQNLFVSDCFTVFEYYKTARKKIDEFEKKQNGNQNAKMILNIVKFLDKYFTTMGLRTYADQINDVITFFKLYKKQIPIFSHVLVDEFQDVNDNQVELLDLINPQNLFCVGDPRQSIFGWRGSNVDYILNFKKKFSEAEIINLKKNYRSNKHIVKFMNKSIIEMKMPDLESDIDGEKEINLINFDNEEAEFNFIKAKILSSEIPREEIFILARTNRQLLDFSTILKKENIPHILKNEDTPNQDIKKGQVTLATIHSIKGLEAKLVFIIGLTQNNFPCKSSDHPIIENIKMYEYDREEEEKRLFYVAISRAKEKLFLTYSGKKHTYFLNDSLKKEVKFSSF